MIEFCRLCLDREGPFADIYSQQSLLIGLGDKIESLCNVKINSNDGFRPSVCELCQNKIINMFNFRNICVQSNELLRTFACDIKKDYPRFLIELQEKIPYIKRPRFITKATQTNEGLICIEEETDDDVVILDDRDIEDDKDKDIVVILDDKDINAEINSDNIEKSQPNANLSSNTVYDVNYVKEKINLAPSDINDDIIVIHDEDINEKNDAQNIERCNQTHDNLSLNIEIEETAIQEEIDTSNQISDTDEETVEKEINDDAIQDIKEEIDTHNIERCNQINGDVLSQIDNNKADEINVNGITRSWVYVNDLAVCKQNLNEHEIEDIFEDIPLLKKKQELSSKTHKQQNEGSSVVENEIDDALGNSLLLKRQLDQYLKKKTTDNDDENDFYVVITSPPLDYSKLTSQITTDISIKPESSDQLLDPLELSLGSLNMIKDISIKPESSDELLDPLELNLGSSQMETVTSRSLENLEPTPGTSNMYPPFQLQSSAIHCKSETSNSECAENKCTSCKDPNCIFVENKKLYKCKNCDAIFNTVLLLSDHFVKTHLVSVVNQCTKCDKTFADKEMLDVHLRTHRPREFGCQSCNKKFKYASQLKIHSVRHMKKFQCRFCCKRFRLDATKKAHEAQHLKVPNKSCSICNKGFFSDRAAKLHQKRHEREPILDEPKRDAVLDKPKRDPVLDRPKRTSKNRKYLDPFRDRSYYCYSQDRNRVICKCCFKSFRNVDLVKIHHRSVEHVCLLCRTEFITELSLQQHPCKAFNNAELHCFICNENFDHMLMKQHLLRHFTAWKKPLHPKKPNCNRLVYELMRLMYRVITCEPCKMSFPSKTLYQKHMQGHIALIN